MWISSWARPPQDDQQLQLWKIYCRIYDDVGLPTPGSWIYVWMRQDLVKTDIYTNNYNPYGVEAIRYYRQDCRE